MFGNWNPLSGPFVEQPNLHGLGQVTKIKKTNLTFVTWPGPGDESQKSKSDFRHLASARWRKSEKQI